MKRAINSVALTAMLFTIVLIWQPDYAKAQTIQLPTFRIFNARTVVSVPDGGSIQLGGVNRSSSGRISRGVPGLSGVPGTGRLFGNRGISRDTSSGRSTVHPRLIIMSELEAEVLAKAARLNHQAALRDPNGSEETKSKADFMTRNIGRARKR